MPRQQDTSEAFTFITEVLGLPLLTLKMDIYHTGKEEAGDDHKFVNERLLEVAIPTDITDGPVKLETCLERYFNNRIEVKRYLERRGTLNSIKSSDSFLSSDSPQIDSAPPYSFPQSPSKSFGSILEMSQELKESPLAISQDNPLESLTGRGRGQSIVRERFILETDDGGLEKSKQESDSARPRRTRKGSIRKEVMMPAWQVFSLIRKLQLRCHKRNAPADTSEAWYTDNRPTSDPELAVHFSEKRPILGICLKRYSVLPCGRTIRLATQVDVPVEIGLPHFIQDDRLEDNGPLCGNFKLSLQAVVCHKGTSADSGHYTSLVRSKNASNPIFQGGSTQSGHSPFDGNDYWLKFDDLSRERVTLIDIEKALQDETPYLLFYQILPIGGDEDVIKPPPYTEINEIMRSPLEKGAFAVSIASSDESPIEDNHSPPLSLLSDTTNQIRPTPQRPVSDSSHTSNSLLPTQNNLVSKKGKSRSRPESFIGDGRLSATLALFRRKSADPLVTNENRGGEGGQNKNGKDNDRDGPARPKKRSKSPDRECVIM